MILGLVVGLVLVAVPLYLWRRPDPSAKPSPEASGAAAAAQVDGAVPYLPLLDASLGAPKIKLAPFKTLRCTDPGPGKTPPERCDHIGFFEDGLARAIKENALCAPTTKTGATVSFVMEVNFRREKLKIYRGKSSTMPRSRTRELFPCLKKAMPDPDWSSIPHQHARYVVAIKVGYPPSETF